MSEQKRPIEEEFAVVVAALLAGRIDGQQAVQSLAALHRRYTPPAVPADGAGGEGS